MLNPKEIGARIKGLRTLKEMTLEEIASKLRVSRSTILRYERGEFERIKLPVLLGIANALGVSPEYLCSEEDSGDLSEALLDFQAPSQPHVNVVKIAGRDGSFVEKQLTDKQLQALKSFVALLPDASDDL